MSTPKPVSKWTATNLLADTLDDMTYSQAERVMGMAESFGIVTLTDVTVVKTPKGYVVEFTVGMHDRSGDDDYSERDEEKNEGTERNYNSAYRYLRENHSMCAANRVLEDAMEHEGNTRKDDYGYGITYENGLFYTENL